MGDVMLQLDVTFTDERIVSGSEAIDVFWNVDRGLAAGAIDDEAAINASPLRLFPGEGGGPAWGRTAWGTGFWSGEEKVPPIFVRTPPVCFGRVRIGAKARDGLGNYQSGAIAESEQVVNSTPLPPQRMERGAFAAGRQGFTFQASPHVR